MGAVNEERKLTGGGRRGGLLEQTPRKSQRTEFLLVEEEYEGVSGEVTDKCP